MYEKGQADWAKMPDDQRDKMIAASRGPGYNPDKLKEMGQSRGGEIARTPSGSVKASARHKAESEGDTMKGGSFPIRNSADLANAKHDVGRAKNPAAARRWINKRAHELGEPPLGG